MLDTRHGADYFRRWHRYKRMSGGLLVHKATHHFDLVNWWVDSTPKRVYAVGSRCYALPETAETLGLKKRTERCLNCPESDGCPYHLDLASRPSFKRLYLDAESEDGYYRDRCVFSEDIDIEDRVSLTAEYANGVCLSYSLNSFLPYEGHRLRVNGTKGRLEMNVGETVGAFGDGSIPGAVDKNRLSVKVFPMFGEPYDVEIPPAVGGHGGGDTPVVQSLYRDDLPPDPLNRAASEIEGAWSALVGIAANRSIESGQPIDVASLVRF
jgi:hypothetical protein